MTRIKLGGRLGLFVLCAAAGWGQTQCSNTSLGNGWTGVACNEIHGFAGSAGPLAHTNGAGQFMLWFCIASVSGRTVAITDNFNTLTALESNFSDVTAGTTVSSSYSYNATDTGSHDATCTSTGTGSATDTVVFTSLQFSGSLSSAFIDVGHTITAVSSPTGVSLTTPTLNANDLIIVYACDNNAPAYAQGTGYTLLSQQSWNGAEAKSVTATGTYSGTFGGQGTDRYTVGIVAVKSITVNSNSVTPAHGGVF